MKSGKALEKKTACIALEEDAYSDDVTCAALGISRSPVRATVTAKEGGILCGTSAAAEVFLTVSAKVSVRAEKKDSERISAGDTVLTINGPAQAVLAGERTALNILSHMSGIATLTCRYAEAAGKANPSCSIYDTRKTLPGLRRLEKYAVACGGGRNHRSSLADQVLIKENHLAASGLSVYEAVKKAKSFNPGEPVETEVENITQLREALTAGADIVMLDDFDLPAIRRACSEAKRDYPGVIIEVSGGVTLENVSEIAAAGADRISIGRITASAPSLDFSLRITEEC